MIKHFTSNNPMVLAMIPIIVLVHFIMDFYFPNFATLMEGYDNLWNIDFYTIPTIYSKIIVFILLCGNAFLLNYIFNSCEFYDRITFIPSILYILLIFLFPISLILTEDLFAHLFFIIFLYQLFNIRQNEDARNNIFLAGFFLGISTTFLPVFSLFIILIYITLFIIRPFSLREFIIPLVGFIVPFLWIPIVNPSFLNHPLHFNSHLHYSDIDMGLLLIIIIVTGILTLIAHKKILERRFKSSIYFRKINNISLVSFFITIIACFLILWVSQSYYYITISITILPFILSYAFLDLKTNWASHILFYSLLILNIIKFFF